jgi:hypothetical protein
MNGCKKIRDEDESPGSDAHEGSGKPEAGPQMIQRVQKKRETITTSNG